MKALYFRCKENGEKRRRIGRSLTRSCRVKWTSPINTGLVRVKSDDQYWLTYGNPKADEIGLTSVNLGRVVEVPDGSVLTILIGNTGL